jgi:hypothetical protein
MPLAVRVGHCKRRQGCPTLQHDSSHTGPQRRISLAHTNQYPTPACLQSRDAKDNVHIEREVVVERQQATVAGIMSTSEFASLELTENTKKVSDTS